MADANQTADEPRLFSLLTRDAMIVFAVLTLWVASDAWFRVTGCGGQPCCRWHFRWLLCPVFHEPY